MKLKEGLKLSISSLVVFILFSEVILRMVNFSYIPLDIGFNITPEYKVFEIIGDNYETKKQKIGIFPKQKFPIKKEKDEIRIFIFGGSSIYILDNSNLINFLKTKLENEFKPKKTRIITIGGNSYGTNRLLLQFYETLEYEPDLAIIYSGHNEFEENYMKEIFFKENILSKINKKFISISKLYQFISMIVNEGMQLVVSSNVKAIKEGRHPFFHQNVTLEYGITFDKKAIYHNYAKNIIEMVSLAKQNDIRIILSTVAYNRKIPPFKSKDDSYFICIRDYYNKSKYRKAAKCLEDALDQDLQPHRATKTSNEIIKTIAITYNVPLADVDAKIVSRAQNKIPGFDLFNDHAHLGGKDGKGNIILQEVFYETIRENKKELFPSLD